MSQRKEKPSLTLKPVLLPFFELAALRCKCMSANYKWRRSRGNTEHRLLAQQGLPWINNEVGKTVSGHWINVPNSLFRLCGEARLSVWIWIIDWGSEGKKPLLVIKYYKTLHRGPLALVCKINGPEQPSAVYTNSNRTRILLPGIAHVENFWKTDAGIRKSKKGKKRFASFFFYETS